MTEADSLPADMKLSSLQDPGDRYKLGDLLGSGAYSEVFEATDQNSGGKRVAIKILTVSSDTVEDLHSEYKILRQHSGHPSLPDLYGVYLKKAESRSENDKLWFVMELCGGGPVTDLVRGVNEENRRMREEHIAYILKEIIKVLVHLYDNNVIHRDVKGSNVLLTKDGEVKLVDFGLSRSLKSNRDKLSSCLGSPCWMAPEVIVSGFTEDENAYDSRVDVWALGITAIELGDGKAPLQGLHPTRALFQILRNPPPRLHRPANWSQEYNDFVAECLEKNPEHRPYIMELLEHPFITAVPENDYHLSMELKILIEDFARIGKSTRKMEVAIRNGCLKTGLSPTPEVMRLEDLAAMETLTEDSILAELHERLKQGQCHTFVGDVLLVLTPNEKQTIYTDEFHAKYQMKARSDNAPHIFSVADRAYQDMLHHEEPQYILLAGETLSGKTTNMAHLLRHLLFLGQSPNKIGDNVEKAMQIVDALSNAATPFNPNSTRHLLQLELTFTATGKVSGAVLWLYQLEKWRITTPHKGQANFHIFYYFYDAMEATDRLERYDLDAGRAYRYLRTQAADNCDENISGVREDPRGNVVKFQELEQHLLDLGFQDDQMDTVCGLIAAILNLGEVRFKQDREEEAELENPEVATRVARLLGVDEEKFLSALTNCCTTQEGTAVGQRHTPMEAEEARDVLACGIYFRLVDWIINVINQKLFFTRAIFSDKYSITLMDLCGFECFGKNGLEQLFINTLNEQLQYHYNQHVFAWEMEEQEVENIPAKVLNYYDNKPTVDELMAKPDGLFHLLDEASRTNQSSDFILGLLESSGKSSNLKVLNGHEFSIAHYTGKVLYDAKDMIGKNRDFLPPEMVETLRLSSNDVVKLLFTNQLSNTGNLIMSAEDCGFITNMKNRWGTALMAGNACRARKYLTESQSQFSQTGQMRTAATTYRGTSLEVLRGAGSGSSHFVRCIRTNLTGQPGDFHHEIVRQQLRALAVVNTAQARQKGYPYRIPFPEFIRRYKFLAFNFDETVDVTMDNCRLLLVRLKLEGWVIGKSKVFLKYYNEEYLSRLYEIQVKKIIKVQALMRVFLAKRKLKFREHSVDYARAGDGKSVQQSSKSSSELTEEKASIIIQKQFRGYCVRKQLGSVTKRKLDVNTMKFILEYYRRWKAKTIFQVLLIYRAARQQDLVYLSQQIHLYNQSAMSGLDKCNKVSVLLERVECGAHASLVLGKQRPTVWKLPFHLQQDFPYFETTNLNDPVTSGLQPSKLTEDTEEKWDAPLQRGKFALQKVDKCSMRDKEVQTGFSPSPVEHFIHVPFCRDPREIASEKSILQPEQQCANSNQRYPSQRTESPMQSLQYTSTKGYGYKKTEVYNPGKARRLEKQRQELDNHSRKWENSNILQNKTPEGIQRNTVSPTLKQTKRSPMNISNNRNSQNVETKTELRRHSEDNKLESTSTTKRKQSSTLKNKDNSYEANENYNPGKRGGGTDYSNNPIVEMEMKGKQSRNTKDTDTPPFNFQAMLRKTNINRASLRRAHDAVSEATTKEISEQRNNKNCSTNGENNTRSRTNSTHRHNRITPASSLSRSDPKESWNEYEHRSTNNTKSSQSESEEQGKYNSILYWSNCESNSDSKKPSIENYQRRSDSNKSEAENERKGKASSSKSSYKIEPCESEFMKSQNKNEQRGRIDSKEILSENKQPGSKNVSNLKKSFNEYENNSCTRTREQWKNKTEITSTTELVPGLIIQGQVTDL